MSDSSQCPGFLDDQKALACVHCGLCLGSCPTYLETGNENDSPRGRIYLMRAVHDGRLGLDHAIVRHIDLCLGCRACEAACPSGVQYGTLIEQTREFIETHHRRSVFQKLLRRIIIERIFPIPSRMKWALMPARIARKTRLAKILPHSFREPLNLLPHRISSDPLPEFSRSAIQPARGTVGFITGCVMSAMFAGTNRASVHLLNEAGFDVVIPKTQVCCGALYVHSGKLSQGRQCAARNLTAFDTKSLDAIIINAAGCGSTLKEYHHLLGGTPLAQQALAFAQKIRDLSEFLVAHNFHQRNFQPWPGLVTYHDACHLAHAQRIASEPRRLVRAVAGANFIELPESDVCCGSAGSYNLTEPAMAARLQARKIRNIASTGAQTIVTTNPGCILQIQSGIEKTLGQQIEVLHLADFLWRSIPHSS